MRRDERSVEAYRSSVDGPLSSTLEEIRRIILSVAPDVEERMAYGMLDYAGLANLAAQKGYVSLYVAPAVLTRHRDSFRGLSCGKSCLRFRRLEQVDEPALRALLTEVRAVRNAARADLPEAPDETSKQEDDDG